MEQKAIVFAIGVPVAISADNKDLQDLYISESKKYSGGWQNGQPLKGIELEDEHKIPSFAQLVGTKPDASNWFDITNEFWADYTRSISFGDIQGGKVVRGTEIDASFTERPDGTILPTNIHDYILYNMLKKDGNVCKNKDEWKYNKNNYKYFMIDKSAELRDELNSISLDKEYSVELAKVLSDDFKETELKIIIINLLGEGDSAFSVNKLDRMRLSEKIMSLSSKNKKKFLEVLKDSDLPAKAKIKQYIEAGVINQNGNTFFYKNQTIGDVNDVIRLLQTGGEEVEKMKQDFGVYKSANAI